MYNTKTTKTLITGNNTKLYYYTRLCAPFFYIFKKFKNLSNKQSYKF